MPEFNIKKIEEGINKLAKNEDATIGDVLNPDKYVKEEKEKNDAGGNQEKKVVALFEKTIEQYQKKIKDFCYYFISLNITIEKPEDAPLIEKELKRKGIKAINLELKDISNMFLNTVTLTKEQINNIKEKFINNKENSEESFEDFLKKNDNLDTIMLYEICKREVKKSEAYGEESKIKNKIEKILQDFDEFKDQRNIWSVLKKETEKGNFKNQIRIIELEEKMEEIFRRKLKKFLSGEYMDIFIKNKEN